jgi:hypothetical protein
MKSPREILLGKYKSENSALDEIRRRALADDASTNSPAVPKDGNWPSFSELLFRLRWHLVGLTTVWTLIAILSALAAGPQNQPHTRALSFAAHRATIARENRRMLDEMLKPVATETSASSSGASLPRSEVLLRFTTV